MTKADYARILAAVAPESLTPPEVESLQPTALRERILVVVEQDGPISSNELSEALDVPVYRVAQVVKLLVNRHLLTQIGHGKATVYAVPDARVVAFRAVG